MSLGSSGCLGQRNSVSGSTATFALVVVTIRLFASEHAPLGEQLPDGCLEAGLKSSAVP